MATVEKPPLNSEAPASNDLFGLVTRLAIYGVAMEYMATHDELTGLLKRGPFLDIANQRLSEAKPGQIYAGLYIDLDNFKAVNDNHPKKHAEGDWVLKAVSGVLLEDTRQSIQSPDLLARGERENSESSRFGGDEFALFVELTARDKRGEAMTPEERLQTFCDRLNGGFKRSILDKHPSLKRLGLSISIGGILHQGGETAEAMFERGDQELTAIKKQHHAENGAYRTV